MTILPKVQEVNPTSGLLQGSVISAYAMYLTWSGMSNEPDAKCNPSKIILRLYSDYCSPIHILVFRLL